MKGETGLAAASSSGARGITVAAVVSRFNPDITEGLLHGARAEFLSAGGSEDDLRVTWVPGAFELPQAVARIAGSGGVDGIVTLGCLIKGETLHFEVLAHGVTQTLTDLSTRLELPLAFGLLTALNRDQAAERSAPGEHNRGAEVMRSLLEMISAAGNRT
ncbi:MAG: 6,7-dimethyl-8-ribityllumazine synthase [Candidatus Marinimicrobia bacterium]|nr:6,7-dimethyl-8-ribityllumazine synthase [Candidatus Neomarinimicrobiota bacterium]